MNKQSYLCRYIASHPNWEGELKKYPYFLKMRRDGNLVCFKYNLYAKETVDGEIRRCDFSLPEQREARGIIIDVVSCEVVCWPFNKFGEYTEPYADQIDWKTARVQDKIDGSIIKLFKNPYTEKWQLSSNTVIDAKDRVLNGERTAGELFKESAEHQHLDESRLDPEYTYIFELVSPDNRVIIDYPEPAIWHIGTRNNRTGKEEIQDIGIQRPAEYPIHSLEECVASAEKLKGKEGYVVVDKDWHRVKVKSLEYLALHRKLNNGVLSPRRIVDILLAGDTDLYLKYYPQKAGDFRVYMEAIEDLKKDIEEVYDQYKELWSGMQVEEFKRKYFPVLKREVCWLCKFIDQGMTPKEVFNSLTADEILKNIRRSAE